MRTLPFGPSTSATMWTGWIYYQDIAVKEEDFCPVDPEERIPFEETDTDYKQLQLNMNQGIKGI